MASTATNISAGHGILHTIAAPFRAIGRFLVTIMENNTRMKHAQYLHSLSDADLEKRGLRREDIVRHVFKDVLYL